MNTLTTHNLANVKSLERIAPYREKLLISGASEIVVIDKASIKYLRSNGNYCEIYFGESKRIVCSKTLKAISAKLHNKAFVRVHQSYIVNMNFLSTISPCLSQVWLQDKTNIPVSRSSRSRLKRTLQLWFD